MLIANEPSIDPISQRPYTRAFAIGCVYRWIIRILCGFFAMMLLVLMLTAILNPFLSRPPMDWGIILVLAALASALLLGFLLHLATLSRKSVMINDEGLWLSDEAARDSFVPWDKVVGMRERSGVPGWHLLDANGQRLLSIDCELDGFDELHGLLREHTQYARRVQTNRKVVWISPAYATFVFGVAALGIFGGWIVWTEGPVGNWWYALGAVALPLYPLIQVIQLRIEPDALVRRFPLWKRQIPRDAIASIRMSQNPFGPAVAIECEKDRKVIMLEHLNMPAHELFESLMAWRGSDSTGWADYKVRKRNEN